jgi:ERF superfamily
MNEIAPISIAPLASTALTLAPPLADSLLNFVARAVKDPAIDVGKLESLLRIQREIIADDARLQFNRAMSAVQGEIQPVLRNARNEQTSSRYANLEAIDAAIRPVYARHGFCLAFNSEPMEGPNVRVVCEVSHTAGHSKEYRLDAALDTAGPKGTGNKTPLHGLGSSVSYLRRYLTCMIFNVVLTNEDNDGNRTRTEPGRLTPGQVEELNELMRLTRTLEAKFLAAMAPDLRSIEEAPAADYPRLKNALLTKKSVLAQRWRASVQAEDAAKATAKMMDAWDANKNGAPS